MLPLLLGPLGKLLGVLALIIALIGLGEWHGRKAVHQQWDAAIARQAMQTTETVIKGAENTAQAEKQYDATVQAQVERVRVVNKEVITYVEGPAQKCVVSHEFKRVFDAVSGMRDADPVGVPAASDTTGSPAEPSADGPTDAEVLQAYEGAVVQLYELWDAYSALVSWVRSSYEIQRDGSVQ